LEKRGSQGDEISVIGKSVEKIAATLKPKKERRKR
jgi:hypothetical protein